MNLQHKPNGGVLPMESRSYALPTESPVPLHLQRHFLARELADLWHVSRTTVTRWAEAEPDVLRVPIGIRGSGNGGKRARLFMLRIPESVAKRIYEQRISGQWRKLV